MPPTTAPPVSSRSAEQRLIPSDGDLQQQCKLSASHSCSDHDVEYPSEPWKTVVAAVMFVCALLANLITLAVVHDYTYRDAVLPDVIVSHVSPQRWAWPVADGIQYALMLCTLLLSLGLHHRRTIVTRRWLTLLAILYTLRVPSLTLTVLPTTVHNHLAQCSPVDPDVSTLTILSRAFRHLTGSPDTPDGGVLCGDLLYSGHTCQMSTAMFIICRYSPRRFWLLRCLVCLAGAFGLVCLVISHSHYTVDVYIALLLAALVFGLYDSYIDRPRVRVPKCVYWLLLPALWLESNVPHQPFDNQISWPFSKPRFLVLLFRRLDHCANGTRGEKLGSDPEENVESTATTE